VAVAVQLLDLREEIGIRLSAIERRHAVPALQRRFDQRAPDELRPAEEQEPHATSQV
jgi:hypothetical protein